MVRYNIRINYGDSNTTKKFYFVHKDTNKLSIEEQNEVFDKVVKELDRIYRTYGKFVTQIGITNLFKHFRFEECISE